MKVQGIERTLVDKVFAVCDYYLKGDVRRHSRHIYDIYKLLPLVKLDDSMRKLFSEVRRVRAKNAKLCPSAQQGTDIREILRKIVDSRVYRNDYENVTSRILEEKIPYDSAVKAIQTLMESGLLDDFD